MSELPKTFDPAEIERRWYAHWETHGLFHPDRPGAEPWTIVNPPPNVTGSLHIGHALDNTLQDILTRHARLKGKDALWVVGTDHAGIATQMVVERQMAAAGDKRTNHSREDFVGKVWEWKAESGGQITRQLRRLGCSMDWANERFTMDEGFSKAVLKVFVDLYNEGLLYRDKRLVNWDPGLGTAISDLEVETREVKGSFWRIRYPLSDGSGEIVVATTRPETMLADMAVAVHPEDERYRHMLGKQVRLPITGRLIPIIGDEHADPTLGTGAVKITPGHDFNDFEVGKRAGMKAGEMLNMLDAKPRVTQVADGLIPDDLLGLATADARKAVVARLKDEGVLVPHVDKDGAEHDAEPRTIQQPFGDRSGAVIEPWLTDQWYVDAATLAQPAIEAVRDGRIRLVPKTWEKTFFNWMENIQPWCVSRQLWWGHRIPAWFGFKVWNDGTLSIELPENDEGRDRGIAADEVMVAATEAAALADATHRYGNRRVVVVNSRAEALELMLSEPNAISSLAPIWRDPDVLDTWFSSALWPFATMGWPNDSARPPFGSSEVENRSPDQGVSTSLDTNGGGDGDLTLAGRYPNDVLVSGFDILFFWNARMMMQGMHFMGDVPFKTLYLHGLVRAADGQKMSKSKGNVVDPLGLIDTYGADALRFFMAAMESQGRDVKMDEKRVEGYRNFATKLWNASRFAQANGIGGFSSLEPPAATSPVNKWIVAEAIAAVQAVDLALADYRFDAAANAIYQFVWSRFCDWYLELIKPVSSTAERGAIDEETKAVAGWVLDTILVLLHPFMPFITEELWHALADRDHDLIVAHWPQPDARAIDVAAQRDVAGLIELVESIRATRAELSVPPGTRVALHTGAGSVPDAIRPYVERMARVDVTAGETTGARAPIGWGAETFVLALEGVIDLDAERARLTKALAAVEKERDALAGRLSNASFVERAKPEAVEKARADHAEKAADAERYAAALERLG